MTTPTKITDLALGLAREELRLGKKIVRILEHGDIPDLTGEEWLLIVWALFSPSGKRPAHRPAGVQAERHDAIWREYLRRRESASAQNSKWRANALRELATQFSLHERTVRRIVDEREHRAARSRH